MLVSVKSAWGEVDIRLLLELQVGPQPQQQTAVTAKDHLSRVFDDQEHRGVTAQWAMAILTFGS